MPNDAKFSPIAPGSVLLHVGMPKSGTTALQFAAAMQRDRLLDLGVLYPGREHSHSKASYAVANRRRGWSTGRGRAEVPDIAHWQDVVEAVTTETRRRSLVSHEYFAEHPPEVCERVVRDLGDQTSVVFTVRNQPSLLASSWQESLKTGLTEPFEDWLKRMLLPETENAPLTSFHRRIALADAITKWSALVGPENTYVIVLDPKNRKLSSRAFESLLDLPEDTLGDVPLTGRQENRSLTQIESEVARLSNRQIKQLDDVTWNRYSAIHKRGAVNRLLVHRTPPPDELRLRPPRWAADLMAERSAAQAAQIAALGVNVLGDLDGISSPTAALDELPPAPNQVPIDIAVDLEFGAFEAANRALNSRDERITQMRGELADAKKALAAANQIIASRADDHPKGLRNKLSSARRRTEGIAAKTLVLALVAKFVVRVRSIGRRGTSR